MEAQKTETRPEYSERTRELKIKILSLADESYRIRQEENRLKRKYHESQDRVIVKFLEPEDSNETFSADKKPAAMDLQDYYQELRLKRRFNKARQKANEAAALSKHASSHIERIQNLHYHRCGSSESIRTQQRAAYLAYGYIRGRPYSKIEANPRWKIAPYDRPEPDWSKVVDTIMKFSPSVVEVHQEAGQTFQEARQEARHKARQDLLDRIQSWKGN